MEVRLLRLGEQVEQLVLQLKETSEDMGDYTMTGIFAKQELNSLHDPKFQNLM